MTSLTDRYLAVALRGIPERQRPDVERELRSSIDDAVEDRVGGGEEPVVAETAVLEGLGDPARLAAGIGGRPLHLIGTELFLPYRQFLLLLLGIVVPIVAVVAAGVELSTSRDYTRAFVDGMVGGLNSAVHVCFWVTLTFALIERADSARDARTEIASSARWSVDRLPDVGTRGVSVGETVSEMLTLLVTLGGLVVAGGWPGFTNESGEVVPILAPAFADVWLPVLGAVLVALVALRLVIFRVGRWTMPLATAHAVLQVGFAAPLAVLALTGSLVSPALAEEVGWPPLAEGTGPVMVWLAIGVVLVTAWEIVDGFRRARRA